MTLVYCTGLNSPSSILYLPQVGWTPVTSAPATSLFHLQFDICADSYCTAQHTPLSMIHYANCVPHAKLQFAFGAGLALALGLCIREHQCDLAGRGFSGDVAHTPFSAPVFRAFSAQIFTKVHECRALARGVLGTLCLWFTEP